jgi:uncharacterized protein
MSKAVLQEADMARHADIDNRVGGGELFLELGILQASGRAGQIDRVAAHKWFNLAAMHGSAEAVELRLEIAREMSDAEIAAAQRAAREWLKAH